jgi:hypothetical protein
MKKAVEEDAPPPDPEIKALVSGDYIDQAIQLYNTEVAATLEFVKEYRALVPYIYTDISEKEKYRSPIIQLSVTGDRDGFVQAKYMRVVRLKYWRALFSNKQFTGRLTSELRQKYNEQIERMGDYEFSAFNIKQIALEMQSQMTQGVEKAIMDLFEKLTSRKAVFIDQKNLCPGGSRLTGCGKSRRSCAYDRDICLFDLQCSSPFFDMGPRPYWVWTCIPSLTGVTQVLVFGIPSTIIMQSVQRPIAQKIPLFSWFFWVYLNEVMPALIRAAAMGSPSSASTGLPSK